MQLSDVLDELESIITTVLLATSFSLDAGQVFQGQANASDLEEAFASVTPNLDGTSRAWLVAIMPTNSRPAKATFQPDYVGQSAPVLGTNGLTTTMLYTETDRIRQDLQVNVFSPNQALRMQIRNAIVGTVGAGRQHWYQIDDGEVFECLYVSDNLIDKAQSTYDAFEAMIVFTVDYGLTTISTATQIIEAEAIVDQDGFTYTEIFPK